MACSASLPGMQLDIDTAYPSGGEIRIELAGAKFKKLYLRIPGWCEAFTLSAPYVMKNGYAEVEIPSDMFALTLSLEMQVRFISADPRVRADAGKVAVTYGPLVYCIEKTDNDCILSDVRLYTEQTPQIGFDPYFGAPVITAKAAVTDAASIKALYVPIKDVKTRDITVRLIPYFGFANRGESDMRVWMRTVGKD